MAATTDEFALFLDLAGYLLNQSIANNDSVRNLLEMHLRVLERYEALPNKGKRIQEAIVYLETFRTSEGWIDEELFFAKINEKITILKLTDEQKTNILNNVTAIVVNEKALNDKKKEALTQIGMALGINSSYTKIIKDYKESARKPASILNQLLIFLVIISIAVSVAFFIYREKMANIKVFDQESVVFADVGFNRMLIYKNQFPIESDHFLKQVVIFINGNAEIGFDPSNLIYNPITKKVTLLHEKNNKFSINLNYTDRVLDQLDPEPISKEEAAAFKPIFTVAGAIGGGVLGKGIHDTIGRFVPTSLVSSLIATGAGAATGGALGYTMAAKLEGVQLSSGVTEREKLQVVNQAALVIKGIIISDPSLEKIFEEEFSNLIREAYQNRGLEISTINYKELSNESI